MDEFTDALDRYVRAMIDYDKNSLSEWGPGSAIEEERDKATREFEIKLNALIDVKISAYLLELFDRVEKKRNA